MTKKERETFMDQQNKLMEDFFERQETKLSTFLDKKIPHTISKEINTAFKSLGINYKKPFEMQKRFHWIEQKMEDEKTIRNKFLTGIPGFIISLIIMLSVVGGTGYYFYNQVQGLLVTNNITKIEAKKPNKP